MYNEYIISTQWLVNGFKDQSKKSTTSVLSLRNYRPLIYACLNSIPNGIVIHELSRIMISQGWIQKLKKGGGGHTQSGVCAAMLHMQFFCVRIMQSVVGGSVGMLPEGNFDHMRVLLRPSEITITTQNLWQLDCNLGDSSISEPVPFGISLCI